MKKLDGLTIEQWRNKYQGADTDRSQLAKECGERIQMLHRWSDAAETIICDLRLQWPDDMPFQDAVISGVRARQAKWEEERSRWASLVNQLACIIIDGEISSNDLDLANKAVNRAVLFLDPSVNDE